MTTAAHLFSYVERLSDAELDKFRVLFAQMEARLQLPFLPNICWRAILSFATFRESLQATPDSFFFVPVYFF